MFHDDSFERIQIENAWLKAPDEKPAFLSGETLKTDEQGGVLKLSVQSDEYASALDAVVSGRFMLGFLEQGKKFDATFEFDSPMPEKQRTRFLECQRGLLERIELDIDKQAGSSE